jgi:hypothetical protein
MFKLIFNAQGQRVSYIVYKEDGIFWLKSLKTNYEWKKMPLGFLADTKEERIKIMQMSEEELKQSIIYEMETKAKYKLQK